MLPDRQTLQGTLAPRAHLPMQLLHDVRAGRDEQKWEESVQDAGDTRQQHTATEGRSLHQVTEVAFTDTGGVGGEEAGPHALQDNRPAAR